MSGFQQKKVTRDFKRQEKESKEKKQASEWDSEMIRMLELLDKGLKITVLYAMGSDGESRQDATTGG